MYDTVMPMHEGRGLPQFVLREIDLPDLRNWEVNSQHYLVLKVEMIGKRNRKDMEAPKSDREKIEADFQVLSIKPLGDEPVDAKKLERQDFEKVLAKAKSGAYNE